MVTLGSAVITTAGTATPGTVSGLAGCSHVIVQQQFTYGSNGGTVNAYLQTSFDQGTTWTDVAAVQFTNATARRVVAVGLGATVGTAIVTPSDGALTANTTVPGLLGDRLRSKVVSTGTYAGDTTLVTTVTVRNT